MARSSAYGFDSGGEDWRSSAACRTEDPELFFPVGADKHNERQIGLAKEVSARCLVQEQCLEFALRTNQEGIWGGLTEEERKAMKRRTARLGSQATVST